MPANAVTSATITTAALYALLDRSDAAHRATVAALDGLEGPLLLITPVLSETMRLADRYLGRQVALALLDATIEGELLLQPLDKRDLQAARRLLRAERGLPAERDLSLGAALAIALALRLGAAALLALEPAARRVAQQEGLHLLPPDQALAANMIPSSGVAPLRAEAPAERQTP